LLGALTARAEAQTVRLALVYALLDGRGEIGTHHLRAPLALWEYADASVSYIWGDALGDPVADEIMRALRQAGEAGRTRTELRDLFGRNRRAEDIDRALAVLAAAGRARRVMRDDTGGRPAEVWVAERVRSAMVIRVSASKARLSAFTLVPPGMPSRYFEETQPRNTSDFDGGILARDAGGRGSASPGAGNTRITCSATNSSPTLVSRPSLMARSNSATVPYTGG